MDVEESAAFYSDFFHLHVTASYPLEQRSPSRAAGGVNEQ